MNDANYSGLDVHQATISVAVLDSTGKLGDGSYPRNESRNDSVVYSWPARQFAHDLGRRNLRCVVARSSQAPRHASVGV